MATEAAMTLEELWYSGLTTPKKEIEMDSLIACPGCGRGFTERGLRTHQHSKFLSLSCKPVQPRYYVHDRKVGPLTTFSAVNPRYLVVDRSNGSTYDTFASAKAARDTAKNLNDGLYS